MDQLHLLRFVQSNVGLAHNIRSNFGLVHYLLDKSIVHRSDVIGVVVGLKNRVQDRVAHVEGRVLLALFQDFAKDSVTLFLPEDLLKFWAHKNEKLKDFDRVLSDVQIVYLDKTHDYLEAIEFQ